jgi:hypothetical protein
MGFISVEILSQRIAVERCAFQRDLKGSGA